MAQDQTSNERGRAGRETGVKKKEWAIHFVEEDIPIGYDLNQADALLVTWAIRAWKKQKEAATIKTNMISSEEGIAE